MSWTSTNSVYGFCFTRFMKTSNFVWISLSSRTTYFSALWYAVPLSSRPRSTRTPARKENATKTFSFEYIQKSSVTCNVICQYQNFSLIGIGKKMVIRMHFLSQWRPPFAFRLLGFLQTTPEDLSRLLTLTATKKYIHQKKFQSSTQLLHDINSNFPMRGHANPARIRNCCSDLTFTKIINLSKSSFQEYDCFHALFCALP